MFSINHYDSVKHKVVELFVASDNREWDKVLDCFDEVVLLDYSSFGGPEAKKIKRVEIISSWKALLSGFDSTQHMVSNFHCEVNDDDAECFCYGLALHYLENKSSNNVLTVVGTYDFKLYKHFREWVITKMKFNFKYMDGNPELLDMARKRA